MIGRGVGHVDRADPVDQHLDPLAREAAQNRARGAGREARRRDARDLGQHFPELPVEIALQFHAFHDRGAREHVELLEARGGDHDFPARGHAPVVKVVGLGRLARILRAVLSVKGSSHGAEGQAKRKDKRPRRDQMTIQHIGGFITIRAALSTVVLAIGKWPELTEGQANTCAVRRAENDRRSYGNWSGRRDSNSRPQPWQGCALPLSYARSLALPDASRSGWRRRD